MQINLYIKHRQHHATNKTHLVKKNTQYSMFVSEPLVHMPVNIFIVCHDAICTDIYIRYLCIHPDLT